MCVFVHGRNVIHLNVRHEQFDRNLNKCKSLMVWGCFLHCFTGKVVLYCQRRLFAGQLVPTFLPWHLGKVKW